MFNLKIIAEQRRVDCDFHPIKHILDIKMHVDVTKRWTTMARLPCYSCCNATHPATIEIMKRNDLMVKNYWGIKVDLLRLNIQQTTIWHTARTITLSPKKFLLGQCIGVCARVRELICHLNFIHTHVRTTLTQNYVNLCVILWFWSKWAKRRGVRHSHAGLDDSFGNMIAHIVV